LVKVGISSIVIHFSLQLIVSFLPVTSLLMFVQIKNWIHRTRHHSWQNWMDIWDLWQARDWCIHV